MAIRRAAIDEPQRGVHEDALGRARAVAARKDIPLRQAVLEVEGIDMLKMARALSHLSGLPVVETIDLEAIQSDAIRQLPAQHRPRERRVAAVRRRRGRARGRDGRLQALAVLDDFRILLRTP